MRVYPFSAITSIGDGDLTPRRHTCISRKFYSKFAVDGLDNMGDDIDEASSDDDDNNGVRQHQSGSSTSRQPFALQPSSSLVVSPPTPHSEVDISSSVPSSSLAVASNTLQRNPSVSTLLSLPPTIWTALWVPRTGRYSGLFSVQDLTDCVYEAAVDSQDPPELEVRGPTVAALATQFRKILAQAVDNGDFTDVLSPERKFIM